MFNFPGLRKNEEILFFIRKHWSAYRRIVFKLLLNIAIAFLIFYFVVDRFPYSSITYFIFIELLILYLLAAWWFTFNSWLDEELDTFVITSERIIDTTQSAFIAIEISSADLDEIQDVRGKIAGFLGGLFRYGNLEVQTASAKNIFFMDHVENPEQYIDTLIELKNQYLAKKNGT